MNEGDSVSNNHTGRLILKNTLFFETGDIIPARAMSHAFFRVVGIDSNGHTLFRQVLDVAELGDAKTALIPSPCLVHAQYFGPRDYDCRSRESASEPWKTENAMAMTLQAAEIWQHNMRLQSTRETQIIVRPK